MKNEERRQRRRIRLRLSVFSGQDADRRWLDGRTTDNVSAGGMYVRVPREHAPEEGEDATFELFVPPREGFGDTPTRLSGKGRVVRVEDVDDDQRGVAIAFTDPLALDI